MGNAQTPATRSKSQNGVRYGRVAQMSRKHLPVAEREARAWETRAIRGTLRLEGKLSKVPTVFPVSTFIAEGKEIVISWRFNGQYLFFVL